MIRHFVTYFIARGLPGILNFAAIFLYSRLLAPEQYGKYAIVLATGALVNSFLLSWLRLGILRYYAAYRAKSRERFLSTVFFAYMYYSLISGILVLLVYGLGVFGENYSANIWLLGLVLLWVSGLFEINLEIYRADLSPKSYGWFYLSRAVLMLGVSLVLITALHLKAEALLIGAITAMLASLLFVAPKVWKGIRFRLFDKKMLLEFLLYGVPLTLTMTMSFIVDSSDRLMLGWMNGEAAAGLYAVTYDFAQQTIILVMTIVNLAAYPLIIDAMENGKMAEVKAKMSQNIVYLLLIALPAAGGMIMLSGNISGLFFGEAYREAGAIVIPWIALVSFIQGIKVFYLDLAFQLSKQTKKQIGPVAAGAVLNIILNFWWIPLYGIKGALAATFSAYVISSLLSWQIGRKIFQLPFPVKESAKAAAATAIMLAALYPIHHFEGVLALMAQVFIGVIVYAASSWMLNIQDIRFTVTLSKVKMKLKG